MNGLNSSSAIFFGKTALMQLQLRTDDDDRTAGIVDAFSEQVLTEASLLSFQRIGERLQRTVVRAAQNAAAAAVVEQRIDGFLQHALFVPDDDVGRVQFDELLQTVVPVDDAAIQIVQIGCREAAAIQRNQRTQLGRNHRNDIENHPFRLVAGLHERFDNLQALRKLHLLLLRILALHLDAKFFRQRVDVDALQKFLDRFGAHHRDELSGIFLLQLAEFFFRQQLALFQRSFTRIDRHVGFEVENALEFAQRHIEQMADAAGQSLEEPDVRTRAGQFDVTETFAAHFRQRDFDAALVADDAAVLHALVLSAQTFPVRHRTENSGAEQAVFFRLERSVVDGFRLGDFAVRPRANLFRRGQTDSDAVKIGDGRRPVVRIRSNQS